MRGLLHVQCIETTVENKPQQVPVLNDAMLNRHYKAKTGTCHFKKKLLANILLMLPKGHNKTSLSPKCHCSQTCTNDSTATQRCDANLGVPLNEEVLLPLKSLGFSKF